VTKRNSSMPLSLAVKLTGGSTLQSALREVDAMLGDSYRHSRFRLKLARLLIERRAERLAESTRLRELRTSRWRAIGAGLFEPASSEEMFTAEGARKPLKDGLASERSKGYLSEKRKQQQNEARRRRKEAALDRLDAALDSLTERKVA
jgi:hypothetical protein